jgi:hypothetical protein
VETPLASLLAPHSHVDWGLVLLPRAGPGCRWLLQGLPHSTHAWLATNGSDRLAGTDDQLTHSTVGCENRIPSVTHPPGVTTALVALTVYTDGLKR